MWRIPAELVNAKVWYRLQNAQSPVFFLEEYRVFTQSFLLAAIPSFAFTGTGFQQVHWAAHAS